jgi:hypothetical protein
LAVAGGAFIVAAPQAGAGQEFSLTGHQTNIQFVSGGVSTAASPNGPAAPGDRIIIREDLMQGTVAVGWDNIVCTVTFNDNLQCDAMYAITNRGDIHLTALLRGGAGQTGPSVFDAVVDGGTFAYANAHGYDHIVNLPNGDSQNNFVLS